MGLVFPNLSGRQRDPEALLKTDLGPPPVFDVAGLARGISNKFPGDPAAAGQEPPPRVLGLQRQGPCSGSSTPQGRRPLDWKGSWWTGSLPLQVSTGAYKRQVHEVPLGKQVTEAMVIEKITWASWTR